MTQDVLKKIKATELESDNRIAQAEAEAGRRITQTRADCEARIAYAKEKASATIEAIAARSETAAAAYIAEEKRLFDEEARNIRIKGEVHLDEAARLIVWGIVNKCQ